MTISPRMLAVVQKVDAAIEQHFADLRARAKRDAEVKARAKILIKARRRPPTENG